MSGVSITTLIAHVITNLSKTSKFDVEMSNLVLKLCEDTPLSLNVKIRNFPVHDVAIKVVISISHPQFIEMNSKRSMNL